MNQILADQNKDQIFKKMIRNVIGLHKESCTEMHSDNVRKNKGCRVQARRGPNQVCDMVAPNSSELKLN